MICYIITFFCIHVSVKCTNPYFHIHGTWILTQILHTSESCFTWIFSHWARQLTSLLHHHSGVSSVCQEAVNSTDMGRWVKPSAFSCLPAVSQKRGSTVTTPVLQQQTIQEIIPLRLFLYSDDLQLNLTSHKVDISSQITFHVINRVSTR